jgi:formiminotetrahydrofolate cyclodeaminase
MNEPAEELGRLAADIAATPGAGAGAVAGGVLSLAAGLCEAVSRASLDAWIDAKGAAVQAAELRRRAAAAASENAAAYAAARDVLEHIPAGPGRDAALRAALVRAAEAPLSIAAIARDTATLAASTAHGCEAGLRADAVVAAELAAATAHSAAALVEVNLAILAGDERREQARDAAGAADVQRDRARAALESG